jgi:uncharacterized protein YidB (DUF937 family)
MPSLLALLGLLAVAGYQNRDKLGQILQGSGNGANTGGAPETGSQETTAQGGDGGLLGELGKVLGGAGAGGSIKQGLDDLLGTFKEAGQHETADSWVTPGVPTQGLSPSQVEAALGKDTLQELATKTGISYDELVKRLSSSIPDAVDRLTPDGKFPQDENEAVDRLVRT